MLQLRSGLTINVGGVDHVFVFRRAHTESVVVNRKGVARQVKPFKAYPEVVVGDGVFFFSKKSAEIAAKKYKRQMIEITGSDVTGWLVLNKPESTKRNNRSAE